MDIEIKYTDTGDAWGDAHIAARQWVQDVAKAVRAYSKAHRLDLRTHIDGSMGSTYLTLFNMGAQGTDYPTLTGEPELDLRISDHRNLSQERADIPDIHLSLERFNQSWPRRRVVKDPYDSRRKDDRRYLDFSRKHGVPSIEALLARITHPPEPLGPPTPRPPAFLKLIRLTTAAGAVSFVKAPDEGGEPRTVADPQAATHFFEVYGAQQYIDAESIGWGECPPIKIDIVPSTRLHPIHEAPPVALS